MEKIERKEKGDCLSWRWLDAKQISAAVINLVIRRT